jgi:uncharacterized membrane protein YedE/YeeE
MSVQNFIRQERWSPYVVGTGIGVLSWVTFGLMGKALGASTTMVRWAGLLESLVASEHVQANGYYAKYIIEKPAIDWQMMLVIGLPLGALLSTVLGKSSSTESIPELWQWRFGTSPLKRYAFVFLGGAIMLFGARLAGGCTSGHGISGGLQFSVSSWIFFASFFTSGIVTAYALFGREGRNHV